jgi:hypothetical protein
VVAPARVKTRTELEVLAVIRTSDITVLQDPTSERAVHVRRRAGRLDRVRGRRIALLDISKRRGDVFLDRLEELLAARGAHVSRYRKPTFTKPAPVHLLEEVAGANDAVVEALAD